MFVCQPNYPAVRDSTSANLSSSQLAPEDEREAQRVEMEADDKEIQKKESQRDEEDADYMGSQESSQESWSGSSQSTEMQEDEEMRRTPTREHEAEDDDDEGEEMNTRAANHNEHVLLFPFGSQPDEWDLDQPAGSGADWPENLRNIRKLTSMQLESIMTAIAQPGISDEGGKDLVIGTIAILYEIKWVEVEKLVKWLGGND